MKVGTSLIGLLVAMGGSSRAGEKSIKARPVDPASIAGRRRSSSSAGQETEIARLTRERDEALEQQRATAEVLKIIGTSRTELQPILEVIVRSAARYCEANDVTIFELDGQDLRMAAHCGAVPSLEIGFRFPCTRGTVAGRTVLERKPVHVIDLQAEAEDFPEGSARARRFGHRTIAGVPLLREGVAGGTIVLRRAEVKPFTEKQIALLGTFAAQAAIAIDNTRLLSELRARTSELTRSVEELRALGEVSQAVNSTLDLQTVLDTVVAQAVQISGTEAGSIYVFDETKRQFQLSATFGMGAEMIVAKREMHAEISVAVGLLTNTHEAIQTPDLRELPPSPVNDMILRAGYRAQLLVPLIRSDEVVGALVVRREAPGEFASSTFDLLKTFAAESVLAIQNARLFTDIENKRRQLELANTAKSRFLAIASHDLRQPLHALGLFVAQLRTPLKPKERAKTVERVDAAVAEMTEMFNSLLDIAKLDSGVLTPKIVKCSIAHLLQKIEATFDQAAREKGLRLRLMPSDAWVRSDTLLLERILLNLVSNAMRYTLRGGIVVGCRRRGEMLRIEVLDSGPGIPEAHKRNIFGEFFQLPTVERDRHGGLGLGLAIVDRLCQLLNHEIELTSTLGRGSRFTILVPLAAEGVRSVETVRSPHPAGFAVEGKLILIIDDAPIVLEGTGGLLGKWGYSVVTAVSDEAALLQLTDRKQRPDLIISDYHLANGKTGIQAIERIDAEFGASIPTILISGDTAPERLRDAKNRGYILLHKPVDPMRLRAIMHQLFKHHDKRADS